MTEPSERGGGGGAQQEPPEQQKRNPKNYYLRSSRALCGIVLDPGINHATMSVKSVLGYRPHPTARSVREEFASSPHGDLVGQFQKTWWHKSRTKTNLGAWASQAMEIHR